jgi:hypothetical protein
MDRAEESAPVPGSCHGYHDKHHVNLNLKGFESELAEEQKGKVGYPHYEKAVGWEVRMKKRVEVAWAWLNTVLGEYA